MGAPSPDFVTCNGANLRDHMPEVDAMIQNSSPRIIPICTPKMESIPFTRHLFLPLPRSTVINDNICLRFRKGAAGIRTPLSERGRWTAPPPGHRERALRADGCSFPAPALTRLIDAHTEVVGPRLHLIGLPGLWPVADLDQWASRDCAPLDCVTLRLGFR